MMMETTQTLAAISISSTVARNDTPRATVARRRNPQGGFVLLTLMFMAGVIAFALVLSIPRSAMQAQRVREETLIYRGEQYKRAVQLYFRKYKKYPQKMDDLEESDGVRYLRKRYRDPLTGEDQWRLIHMGADGRFKDSLLYDQQKEEDENGNGMNATGGRRSGMGSGTGSRATGAARAAAGPSYAAPTNAFQGAELARANRQSAAPDITGQTSSADIMAAGLPDENGQAGDQPADPSDPNAPAQDPSQPGGAVPYPNYAGTLPSQIPSATGAGAPVIPGMVNPVRGGLAANQPGVPRQVRGGRSTAAQLNQLQQMAGAGGMPPGNAPVGFGGAAGRSAADLIRSLITTPRPGGLAGIRGAQQGAQGNRPSFSEGIAGVASKVESRGVKVYQDREMYNEWEFVYDYRTDAAMVGMAGAGGPAGNINPGQPGLSRSGSLQIDPSQVVPVPGIAGFNGQAPTVTATPGMDANNQPADGSSAGDPGLPPFGEQPPLPDATNQPENTDSPGSRLRSRRRRTITPLPLPGQSIYPGANPAPPTGQQPGTGTETESPQPAVDPNAP